MLTRDDFEQIAQIMKAQTEPIIKRLDGVDKRLVALEAKVDKVQESVDIVQNVVVEHHMKLEKRVSHIENHLSLSHRS